MGNNTFANRIKNLRINANLTMDEFSKKFRVSKSSVSMWENNGVVPRNTILKEISQEYSVSIDYLLGNEEDGYEQNSSKLKYLQRGLGKLDDRKLQRAEQVLKAVFDDIFEEEEDHDGL